MIAELERLTRDYFDIEEGQDNPHSHLDYVEAWQASGKTLNTLAAELGLQAETITRYLRYTFGKDETDNRLRDARRLGAHQLVEDALDRAETATTDNVNVRRLQVSTLQWTAEKWNPAELGKANQTGHTINIGTLHLEALKMPLPLPRLSDGQ